MSYMPKLPKEVLADLTRSGITEKDAERMKICYIPASKMRKIFPDAKVPAYEIPYLDIDGEYTRFSRYKLLGEFTPKGAKKPAKYLQLPGTESRFYYPPFLDWNAITSDTTIPIYFTEGEKKAVALCKLGLAAIGLAGVWNWRTRGGNYVPSNR